MQSRIIQDRVAITIETKIYYIIKPYGDPNVVPNHWGPHSHYHSIGNPNAVPNVFSSLSSNPVSQVQRIRDHMLTSIETNM